ncbi:MAG: hypothetical protein ACRDP2_09950 [Nocardioidaceae bacterium]
MIGGSERTERGVERGCDSRDEQGVGERDDSPAEVEGRDRALTLARSDCPVDQVLLMPATKTPAWKRRAGVKVCVVRDPAGLLDAYDRLRDTVDTLVAQEYVSGGDDQL